MTFAPGTAGWSSGTSRSGRLPSGSGNGSRAIGLRPINNVVDVSNYVLFATAQPIHAFDFGKLAGSKIIVRRATRGETIRDLEGRTLELTPEMLVIADEAKPVALAGIIGGQESAVSGTTRDVFIESANFDPVSIRLTSKKLGLSTDASYRYERGADISILPKAALMVASLLSRMGGKAARGILDVYPKPRKAKPLLLRGRRVADLLGVEMPGGFVETGPRRASASRSRARRKTSGWSEAPAFRVDIDREADLIEEIARFYGYDRIPSEVPQVKSPDHVANRNRDRILKLRRAIFPTVSTRSSIRASPTRRKRSRPRKRSRAGCHPQPDLGQGLGPPDQHPRWASSRTRPGT